MDQNDTQLTTVSITINGAPHQSRCRPDMRLLDYLRINQKLTGTKEGCGEGECGACSVILNGELVNACLVPMGQIHGAKILTIEGIAPNGTSLHPVQEAFWHLGGSQCGICTPGMIMAAVHLLETNPRPSRHEIQQGLAGNLCRCTGYQRIFEAVEAAAKVIEEQSHPSHGGIR